MRASWKTNLTKQPRLPVFEGTEPPVRQWRLDVANSPSAPLELAVHEWGEEKAPILLLAHGGADFARTYDRFAPRLARAGYRVIAWDHRGHGDSDRAQLYSWDADIRDASRVLERLGEERPGEPLCAVGHSKGGGLLADLVSAFPERFRKFVNIDGIPWKHDSRSSDLSLEVRVERRAAWLAQYLDKRRELAEGHERRPGTLEELAKRRARHNPRLSEEWLRYLVSVGAQRVLSEEVLSEDSNELWRWKLDPAIRMGTPGPWRPEWGLVGLREIRVPMMVILGRVQEPMGWGTDPDGVAPHLPDDVTLEVYEDSGHFVHIEHPERTANDVLEFLA